MKIEHTRALLNAALEDKLNNVEYRTDPVFGVEVPTSCPGVPDEVLNPRETWADPDAYDKQAAKLVELFRENFRKFADQASDEVKAAGPGEKVSI
jgi:phosphoenolpyruvate carboxykinase (ATP)